MIFWYETTEELTAEQAEQRRKDYALMFYGSMANKAIFAELQFEIDKIPDSVERNILKDFMDNIKARCGLKGYERLVEAESKCLIERKANE